jgi:predicted RNase H-like nuclease
MPKFIGIDLAWKTDAKHTGVAALAGDQSTVELYEKPHLVKSLADVEAFILRNAEPDVVVAIDAPLVLKNVTGQRPCETEISRRFGAAHAGAHTSNLKLYPKPRSVQLAKDLEANGFVHCPHPHSAALAGKWFFEVYPHPAHVVLFGLPRIVKYKKGAVPTRRAGLSQFRDCLLTSFSVAVPALKRTNALDTFLGEPLETMAGPALKEYEDRLDALFCAYLAAHFWAWSYGRNEMIGTLDRGYIINPTHGAAPNSRPELVRQELGQRN